MLDKFMVKLEVAFEILFVSSANLLLFLLQFEFGEFNILCYMNTKNQVTHLKDIFCLPVIRPLTDDVEFPVILLMLLSGKQCPSSMTRSLIGNALNGTMGTCRQRQVINTVNGVIFRIALQTA